MSGSPGGPVLSRRSLLGAAAAGVTTLVGAVLAPGLTDRAEGGPAGALLPRGEGLAPRGVPDRGTTLPVVSGPAVVSSVDRVAQLTGPGSLNDTAARWDVVGADLGHMFWYDGAIYMVFGDTLGVDGADWRSNTMARIPSPDPAAGLRFGSMITGPAGRAAELLPSLKIDNVEKTVIPTYGIAVGGRMFLHYMSVRHWGAPGQWDVNYSGLAYSDDGGRTWVKDAGARWPGGGNLAQVAMVESGGDVYLFGIPAGRSGGVQLARVAESDLLELSRYTYWDGASWSVDPARATLVVPGPVGELSVAWNSYVRRWLMMYLDVGRSAIVVRSAPELTGPWGPEQVVATAAEYPELYAPYIVPMDTGRDVYFTMSQSGPYEVYLMRMRLG